MGLTQVITILQFIVIPYYILLEYNSLGCLKLWRYKVGCIIDFMKIRKKFKIYFRKINPLNIWLSIRENEQLKRIIRQWGCEIMNRLKLPLIKIEFSLEFCNCAYTKRNSLLFGLWFLKRFKDKGNYTMTVPPMEFFDRLYFIVAHETAHYLQKYKYPKWHKKYLKEDKENSIDTSIHSRQKIERNASKIAGILLKEYKNKINP